MNSWYSIEGKLEAIDHQGPTQVRFPETLVEPLIQRFSAPGQVVLDPFAGYGTTLKVAERLGRRGIGFEPDSDIFDFAMKQLNPKCRLINDVAENCKDYSLPPVDLLLCSPPIIGSHRTLDEELNAYLSRMGFLFTAFKPLLRPGARLLIETVNKYMPDGSVMPLAFHVGILLASLFRFQGELVFCNQDGQQTTPGFEHSFMLVYDHPEVEG